MGELPVDLVIDGFWPVGSRQTDGPDRVRGGAQRVRPHVADGYGLTSRSGSRSCRGVLDLSSGNTADESTADLLGSVQLSSRERPSAGDSGARAVIRRSASLEQPQNSLGTVGGPCGDKTSLVVAQRLRRSHIPTLGS
jgi:hypothetical protein